MVAVQDRPGEHREGLGLGSSARSLGGPAGRDVDHPRCGHGHDDEEEDRHGVLRGADLPGVQWRGEQVVGQGAADHSRRQRRGHAAQQGDSDRRCQVDHQHRRQRTIVGPGKQRQRQQWQAQQGEDPRADTPGSRQRVTPAGPAPAGATALVGDDVHVDLTGVADHLGAHTLGHHAGQTSPGAGAQHDLGGVDAPGEGQDGRRDLTVVDLMEGPTELFGKASLAGQHVRRTVDEAVGWRHVQGQQLATAGALGDARATAQQGVSFGATGERHHHPLAGRPRLDDVVRGAITLQRTVHPIGGPQQREFAQGGEIALAEVVGQGGVDLVRAVDVAVCEAATQGLWGHVDQFDLVGATHHIVWHRLGLLNPGDRLDDVVERLQVLDVDGGDDVDPGVQDVVDVLPPLAVP